MPHIASDDYAYHRCDAELALDELEARWGEKYPVVLNPGAQ
jgi:hypothetical protein